MTYFSLSKRLFLAIFLVFMSGCSILKNELIANPSFYKLQQVPESLTGQVLLESLTFIRSDEQKLISQLEFSSQNLNMVAMTYSGLPIIQAKWNKEQGLYELVSQQFSNIVVLQIIRDIQWVKWPEESITKGLANNYILDVTIDKNGNQHRQIKHNNKTIVNIRYFDNKIVLTNTMEQYELVIERLNDK